MAKYSFEFKKKIVDEYLNGEGGYCYLCKKYGIPSTSPLERWVAAYNSFGPESLMRSRKKQKYTLDFKLHVVELYLTTEVSYQDLALQVGITNPSQITKWVNDFRIAGPDALKPKRKGRPPNVKKPNRKPVNTKQEVTPSFDSDELKRLQEENLKLRIENAYLKELRRLRLEGIPLSKERE